MKFFRSIIVLCLLLVSVSAIAQNTNPDAGKFSFKKETHNFGNIKTGSEATCDFTFTNTGKTPIVISECTASCGCTVPTWPKEPIMPGNTSKITVAFDTKNKSGSFMKAIYIKSNAYNERPAHELYIKGVVLDK
jgi:Protein of unknown function (DUF1573)